MPLQVTVRMQEPEEHLQRQFSRWRYLALLEYVLYGLALAVPVVVLLRVQYEPTWAMLLLTGAALASITTTFSAWRSGWPQAAPLDLAHYLNRTYPVLEDSADLLLTAPGDLPPLARRQRQRVAGKLKNLEIRLPHHLPRAGGACLIALLISLGLMQLPGPKPPTAAGPTPGATGALPDSIGVASPPPPPELRQARILIQPPAYTRLPTSSGNTLDIEAPAGSSIHWTLTFEPAIAGGRLTTGDGRELPLRESADGAQTASLQLDRSTFYSLHYRGEGGEWLVSDYYRLEALPDRAPRIEVQGLPQYIEYPYREEQTIRFNTLLSDDYGISDARLIATVSSGEGESVQFRDDTLRFDASFRQERKRYELPKTLRLTDLGMGPGDELYLHLEAFDTRRPDPQVSKTFKYIIAFEDPEAATMDMAGGLAVDRLPEYFRSQRQIIIDTEKLIAREKELAAVAFQEQSNNIAIDQKLLRLRYGRFLGEEFQTVIGEMPVAEADEGHEEHDHEEHDHEEHEKQTDKWEEAAHDHEHAPAPSPSEDGAVAELEPYYHTHDITEEATFFDAATTAKLRTALSQMWDAELHLRLGRPRQALPFEYRALKLIKEIQQASRIYVERVGFEPPAINVAEKRLTGELEDIVSPWRRRDTPAEPPFPAVAAAAPLLETLLEAQRRPDPREYRRLQAAGEELAALALEQPGGYLLPLQQLRAVMENEGTEIQRQQYLRELQRVFWSLLPDSGTSPRKADVWKGELGRLYLEELQKE